MQLTDVQVTNQGTSDKVVFKFSPKDIPVGPRSWEVKEVAGPFAKDPSDEPMTIAGSTFLQVTFNGASGVDLSGNTAVQTYTGPTQITPNHPTVADVALREDFERTLGWVVGLNQKRCPSAKVEAATALVLDFPH